MIHIPVLENEILEIFEPLCHQEAGVFVDGTLGLGGHSSLLLSKAPNLRLIAIDKDEAAISKAHEKFRAAGLENRVQIFHDDFKNIKGIVEELNIKEIDGAMLDLGVSSLQFDDTKRGFSFRNPSELLDMRMDESAHFSAYNLVNEYPQAKLIAILREYGEENFASSIARKIVEQRKIKSISTVGDLLDILEASIPIKVRKTSKIHFATRTFQAFRIEVNHELGALDQALSDFSELLKPGARLAVISFHSLEDRIVKHTFQKLADPCQCPRALPCVCGKFPTAKILTKKPILPSDQEISENPRSRSAKLRVIEII